MLSTNEDVTSHRRSLRCRLGFHRWVLARDASGEKATLCERCGYVTEIEPPWGTIGEGAAFWAGPRGGLR